RARAGCALARGQHAHRHPQDRDGGLAVMGLFDALGISSSGLTAERMRMDVTAENLANAQSVGYRRKDVVVRETAPQGGAFGSVLAGAMGSPAGSGVEVQQITQDPSPGRRVYDPGNPAADKQGYVVMPNVNPVTGQASDPSAVVMAVEKARLSMQLASQIRTKAVDAINDVFHTQV